MAPFFFGCDMRQSARVPGVHQLSLFLALNYESYGHVQFTLGLKTIPKAPHLKSAKTGHRRGRRSEGKTARVCPNAFNLRR
jgi:hypothetical protein